MKENILLSKEKQESQMAFLPERRELMLDINPQKAYSLALIGQTRSGKSFLLNHLMERYFSHKINILMTDSPNADIYKSGFFSSKDVIKAPGYYSQLIKDSYKINKACDNKYQFMFVIDDIVDKKNDKQLFKVSTIYRNSNISMALVGQRMAILPSTVRGNTNFIFLGRLGNDYEIENTIKAFLQTFFPKDFSMYEKIQAYKDITKNYNFICLDNINGEVFITKAK
jgi:GTPase SAR1 family protein